MLVMFHKSLLHSTSAALCRMRDVLRCRLKAIGECLENLFRLAPSLVSFSMHLQARLEGSLTAFALQ